jgi:hypothetical protein
LSISTPLIFMTKQNGIRFALGRLVSHARISIVSAMKLSRGMRANEMRNFFKKTASAMLCAVLFIQLASCGTLLYPDRRGQKTGQIDVAIVLMDAIGLFFFIIPGVVAFAVDLDTGAIYLPSSGRYSRTGARAHNAMEREAFHMVRVNSAELDPAALTRIIAEQTGCRIQLDDPDLLMIRVDEQIDLDQTLIRLRAEYDTPCLAERSD